MKDVLSFNGLYLYRRSHRCFLNGEAIRLTDTEFAILETLLENEGQTVSVKELARYVWPNEEFVQCNDAISVHVHHIRKKINDTQKPYNYVKTTWGIGYRVD